MPQGLKSSPVIPDGGYSDLGFNPVPGDRDVVKALHEKLTSCAKVLHETHGIVTKLMDGSYWEGDAAVAFREQIDDGPLPKNLQNAANSVSKAAKHLSRWHGELDGYQRRAKLLNADAKEARAALEAAQGRADTAGRDPDLDKKGGRRDDAVKAQARADGKVDEAQADLDRILKRARDLAYEHEERSGYRAGKIRAATHKLAPQEPGWFDTSMDWIKENLPDILSTLAAVVGFAALFVLTGGTAAAVLLLAAAALSGTALGLRLLGDPGLRASLWDGFTKYEFDTDFWSNAVTLGGDVLGVVPGVGAAWKGGAAALRGVGEAGGAVTLGTRLAHAGVSTMEHARTISSLDNSLLGLTIRGARAAHITGTVEVTSAAVGVGTAVFGLAAKAVDADDDGIKDGAVAGIDGSRIGVDGGGLIDVVRHLLR
ncbi:putative T7SS-secreted protein [Streptomyces sp. NPDC050439]|uniref:putative T7SS-secreted protein n=1 Tax=unclassified Streptomyces TaxID=2593676 RepID=UPI00341E7BC0